MGRKLSYDDVKQAATSSSSSKPRKRKGTAKHDEYVSPRTVVKVESDSSEEYDSQMQHFSEKEDNCQLGPEQTNSPIRQNKHPIPFEQSVYLVVSSCFFLIPGAYAFISSWPLVLYGLVSVVTTLVSANYWRDAVSGSWRHKADLVIAKVSFVIYFVSGIVFFGKNMHFLAVGIPGCLAIITCYVMSLRMWDADSSTWVYFHMMFHLFVALEQFLVLYGGALYYDSLT
jgi:hypothetical protein